MWNTALRLTGRLFGLFYRMGPSLVPGAARRESHSNIRLLVLASYLEPKNKNV